MKLSELVAYRNHLSEFDVGDIRYTAQHKLEEIVYNVKNSVIQPRAFTQTLEEDRERVTDAFDHFSSTFLELINELDSMIETAEKMQYVESTRLYNEEVARYGRLDESTNKKVRSSNANDPRRSANDF